MSTDTLTFGSPANRMIAEVSAAGKIIVHNHEPSDVEYLVGQVAKAIGLHDRNIELATENAAQKQLANIALADLQNCQKDNAALRAQSEIDSKIVGKAQAEILALRAEVERLKADRANLEGLLVVARSGREVQKQRAERAEAVLKQIAGNGNDWRFAADAARAATGGAK